jgi:hypothetical protein
LLLRLVAASAAGRRRGRSTALGHLPVALVHLLLPLCQFPQALQRFIQLLILRLLLAALYRLILILELVEFQLEKVGKILGVRL